MAFGIDGYYPFLWAYLARPYLLPKAYLGNEIINIQRSVSGETDEAIGSWAEDETGKQNIVSTMYSVKFIDYDEVEDVSVRKAVTSDDLSYYFDRIQISDFPQGIKSLIVSRAWKYNWFYMYIIDELGDLYAAGNDSFGSLAVGNPPYSESGIVVYLGNTPTAVTGEAKYLDVKSIDFSTLALKTNGKLQYWGWHSLDGIFANKHFMQTIDHYIEGLTSTSGYLSGKLLYDSSPASAEIRTVFSGMQLAQAIYRRNASTDGWLGGIVIHLQRYEYYPNEYASRSLSINGNSFHKADWAGNGYPYFTSYITHIYISRSAIDALGWTYSSAGIPEEEYGEWYVDIKNQTGQNIADVYTADFTLDILLNKRTAYYLYPDVDLDGAVITFPEATGEMPGYAFWDDILGITNIAEWSFYLHTEKYGITSYNQETRELTLSSSPNPEPFSGIRVGYLLAKPCAVGDIIENSSGSGFERAASPTEGMTLMDKTNEVCYRYLDGSWDEEEMPEDVTPTDIFESETFIKISNGKRFWAAIKTDGTLVTWGDNSTGQLGNGSTTASETLVTVSPDGIKFKDVCCGHGMKVVGESETYSENTITYTGFVLAIDENDLLWAWGDNSNGQLGLGDKTMRTSPVRVPKYIKFKSVHCNSFNEITEEQINDIVTTALTEDQVTEVEYLLSPHSYSFAIDMYGRLWGWGNLDHSGHDLAVPGLDPTYGNAISDVPTVFSDFVSPKLLNAKGTGCMPVGWSR